MPKYKEKVVAPKFIGDGSKITVGNIKLADIKIALERLLPCRILAGTVESDGSVVAGGGFTVDKLRERQGEYLIKFDQPFSGRPSGSVTQVYPSLDEFKETGDTTDNAVIGGIDKDQFRVITGNSQRNGVPDDRCFTFIIVGPK